MDSRGERTGAHPWRSWVSVPRQLTRLCSKGSPLQSPTEEDMAGSAGHSSPCSRFLPGLQSGGTKPGGILSSERERKGAIFSTVARV